MKKKPFSMLTFALTVALLVIALKILNWVPGLIQTGSVRQYKNLDEVRTSLNVKGILVPSYFPQEITWPPTAILAQKKPYFAITMRFTRANKRDTVLVLSQSEGAAIAIENPLEITTVTQTAPYTMQGRNVTLKVGSCSNGAPCSSMNWTEGSYQMFAAMKSGPFELIKIVESMFR